MQSVVETYPPLRDTAATRPKMTPHSVNGRMIGFWLHTKVTEPESSAGRSVEVFVPVEVWAELMKELRGLMIYERSEALSDIHPKRD